MKHHGIILATAAALALLAGCVPYYDGYYYGDGYRGPYRGYSYGNRDGYRRPPAYYGRYRYYGRPYY